MIPRHSNGAWLPASGKSRRSQWKPRRVVSLVVGLQAPTTSPRRIKPPIRRGYQLRYLATKSAQPHIQKILKAGPTRSKSLSLVTKVAFRARARAAAKPSVIVQGQCVRKMGLGDVRKSGDFRGRSWAKEGSGGGILGLGNRKKGVFCALEGQFGGAEGFSDQETDIMS
jgi:hypothetical protein